MPREPAPDCVDVLRDRLSLPPGGHAVDPGNLDRVALTAAATSDDDLPAGVEGTVVSIDADGSVYIVEFTAPPGAHATVEVGDLRRVERAAV